MEKRGHQFSETRPSSLNKPVFGIFHVLQPQEKLRSKILVGAQLWVLQRNRLKVTNTSSLTNYAYTTGRQMEWILASKLQNNYQ